MKKRKWIAFFSHSGSEIVKLVNRLGYKPDVICTNNPKWYRNHELEEIGQGIVDFRSKWLLGSYQSAIGDDLSALVTLHGWMRIIPADICEQYEIYNGHPALCDRYPELKGKDQQEAVINHIGKYPTIGSIIHRCTPVLDSGEVVERREVTNFEVADRSTIYSILRDTSLYTWMNFLPKHLE